MESLSEFQRDQQPLSKKNESTGETDIGHA
jgi:hypothetical protein